MRHLGGIGALVAVALALRFWPFPSVGLDIYVHEVYRVIPLRLVCFWFLIGGACMWLLVFAWASIHRAWKSRQTG
jgi:hypothetical protein